MERFPGLSPNCLTAKMGQAECLQRHVGLLHGGKDPVLELLPAASRCALYPEVGIGNRDRSNSTIPV